MKLMCDGLNEQFMVEVEKLQTEEKVTRDGLRDLFNGRERTNTEHIVRSNMGVVLTNDVSHLNVEVKDICDGLKEQVMEELSKF